MLPIPLETDKTPYILPDVYIVTVKLQVSTVINVLL